MDQNSWATCFLYSPDSLHAGWISFAKAGVGNKVHKIMFIWLKFSCPDLWLIWQFALQHNLGKLIWGQCQEVLKQNPARDTGLRFAPWTRDQGCANWLTHSNCHNQIQEACRSLHAAISEPDAERTCRCLWSSVAGQRSSKQQEYLACRYFPPKCGSFPHPKGFVYVVPLATWSFWKQKGPCQRRPKHETWVRSAE